MLERKDARPKLRNEIGPSCSRSRAHRVSGHIDGFGNPSRQCSQIAPPAFHMTLRVLSFSQLSERRVANIGANCRRDEACQTSTCVARVGGTGRWTQRHVRSLWRAPPRMSSPSTTSAARASNGSKKAKAQLSGRGYHVGRSLPTRFVQLRALPYNLSNFLRTLATPEPIKDWSLTSVKEKLIKIGSKIVSHGRYVAYQMAEVVIPQNLFGDILRMIAELRPPPNPAPA